MTSSGRYAALHDDAVGMPEQRLAAAVLACAVQDGDRDWLASPAAAFWLELIASNEHTFTGARRRLLGHATS